MNDFITQKDTDILPATQEDRDLVASIIAEYVPNSNLIPVNIRAGRLDDRSTVQAVIKFRHDAITKLSKGSKAVEQWLEENPPLTNAALRARCDALEEEIKVLKTENERLEREPYAIAQKEITRITNKILEEDPPKPFNYVLVVLAIWSNDVNRGLREAAEYLRTCIESRFVPIEQREAEFRTYCDLLSVADGRAEIAEKIADDVHKVLWEAEARVRELETRRSKFSLRTYAIKNIRKILGNNHDSGAVGAFDVTDDEINELEKRIDNQDATIDKLINQLAEKDQNIAEAREIERKAIVEFCLSEKAPFASPNDRYYGERFAASIEAKEHL